jgi:O-antigen/teichoic acid export membrane protein
VALAGMLAVISFGASDFIAVALREPRLGPLLQVFAVSLLLQPLVVVPLALLRRDLRFQVIPLRNVAAQLIAGMAAAWRPTMEVP